MRARVGIQDLFLDWTVVRALGGLQLLARASYITLVVAPLLAGMWPGIRSIINDLGPEPFVVGPLPDFWVFAFLAALAALMGRTFYQVAPPERVRASGLDEYGSSRRRAYAENPSDGMRERAALMKAIGGRSENPKMSAEAARLDRLLESVTDARDDATLHSAKVDLDNQIEEQKQRRAQLVERLGYDRDPLTDELPSPGSQEEDEDQSVLFRLDRDSAGIRQELAGLIEQKAQSFWRTYAPAEVDLAGLEHRYALDEVEIGARIEYLADAALKRVAALVALGLYAASLGLIVYLTWLQTVAVLKAAEWL